ncbi:MULTISPECIES: hypothetical protein [unclassified Burkholderia]|uniref:hypothetical protein n=1 Tax=unclassified Burkholderia TaxID=2613784 RepID=UPI000753DC4F|nr:MULTISPECIES: hypothetical protein [unclassified Burkholderia]KUY56310.1 hypothetical protein WS45_17475 [Burkholderia sp. RF2-non_BP3]KUY70945.1 hypothetical protein WS46_31085 [Burkholderia sp. RF4-BP95]KUZ03833.1 hypothetical protein WS48_32590 [Burkholderia sp. RF7-non_BP1]KUZ05036.1 hypothetical protein WS49_07045 [Burkholderia sp. RF7-non_BP4]
MLSFAPIGRTRMLTYQDLSARYQAYQEAKSEYRCYLQQCIARFATKFEAALALPSPTWRDANGVLHHYVELGVVEDGQFVMVPAAKIEGDDRSIRFAVGLTLEARPGWLPKTHHVQEVVIRATQTSVEFNLVGDPTLTVGVVRDGSTEEFSTVIGAMIVRIYASMDPDVFKARTL